MPCTLIPACVLCRLRLASRLFPASASARTTRGETATLNRAMTIPVTGAARLAKPEAPRAAGRTRRPRGCRDFTEHSAGGAGR
jgi:hypothetical protein